MSVFLNVKWASVNPIMLVILTCIFFVIKIVILGWFKSLLQKGSTVAVILQTIILLPAIGLIWDTYETSGGSSAYYAGLSGHTAFFSFINLILAPAIVAANWSVILKIRQGKLQVVNQ